MPLKVAIIGAGSVGFTRKLFRDILSVPELVNTEFAFTDIDEHYLDMIAQLCKKDIRTNKLSAQLTTTLDRRRALAEADYVINVSRIGGLEAFKTDIEIPLKYGVDQCIGDTLAPGGIMYGQRSIPCILDFCKDIREVAKDNVIFLNYANPNAMNTWAAIDFGKVKTIGLCHGIEGGREQIAEALGANSYKDVEILCAGINHQTWYLQIMHKGKRIESQELLEAFERHPVFSKTEKVRIDVLRRIGYFSTESNGHLSEYLPWYRKRPNELNNWIDHSSWIHGKTAGYLNLCLEERGKFETEFADKLAMEDPRISPEGRSLERASYIIEALETGRSWRGHFNVKNNGCISNLPDDCIVEVPGNVDRNGISITQIGELPLACTATLSASIHVQRMAVLAAVKGDLLLLKQAMLHDPLTAAVCTPEEIWQMTDEMLVAQAQWLPQYNSEIPGARKHLAEHKSKGTFLGTKKGEIFDGRRPKYHQLVTKHTSTLVGQ